MSDNTVFCRECNAQNQAGNKFCSNCGASLKPATHITCPSCYHRNPLNLLYCDNCGTRLVREGAVDDDPASEDDTQPLNVPTGFSLPSRDPGDTADLDPDSLPDWLKTGGDGSNTNDDNWLDDLKEASTSDLSDLSESDDDFLALDDDLGGVNLDWLTDDDEAAEEEEEEEELDFLVDDEPLEIEPQPSPEDDFTLTGIVDTSGAASDFDWLSVMGDVETDEEPAESTPTGFTGLLSPEMLEAFENTVDEEPTETTSEEIAELGDWLVDQSADDQAVLAFDDEDETADEESEEEETTGFTDWLQATTVEDDVQPATAEEIPDWLSPPAEEKPQAAEANDDWLNELGDDFDTDDDLADTEDEPLPDWLDSPGTGPLASEEEAEEIGTGFTGWLNAQHVDDFLAEQELRETPEDDAAEELPDWLDAPETGPLPQSEPISTGFTNLLDSSLVDQFEEEAEQAQQAEEPAADEVPNWLSSPLEEEDEDAGTGFTDWLTQADDGGEADDDEYDEDDDDDFDWLDEEKTQELMKPLTTEEAEKLLEDTPDVSEDFIKEVVGGDFPEWLTDVETLEDPGDTGVLPAWISAPVSESDTLTLGLGRDMPLPTDDDWLADLAGSKQDDEDNDWFSELATTTAAADEDLFASDDDDEAFDDDFLDELGSTDDDSSDAGSEFADDLFAESATAVEESADDDAWLADLPALEDESLSDDDDWLADMPGINDEASASTEDNWLVGMPDMDNTSEILDDVFSDMPEESGTGADDWLADMPDQEEEQDTEGWMSSFGELGSKAAASLDWMEDLADEEEEEEADDEFEPWGAEEESAEPRDPTFIDPVLDFENFEAISDDTNAGELDWLSVIESTSADGVVEEDEEDPEAWLTGSDLEQEESGSYILDENLHAVVFKEDEEDDYPDSDDTDTLGDNWEVDLLAPISSEDDTDIMQELRALRSTDRLDPEIVEAVRQDEEDPEIVEFISNREERTPLPRTTPDWITDGDDTLTNWVVDPFEREEPAVQEGGPLDGLSGVVTIAPAMAVAPTIARSTAAAQLQVSAEHQQHANLLRQLARGSWAAAPPPTAVAEAQPAAGNRSTLLLRLVLGLLLITALVVGMIAPNLLPTSIFPTTPELRQVNTVLSGLNGQSVLVAFEYSPTFAGELNPQAQLFLNELAQNGNRVVLMSQYPAGLANARPLVTNFDSLESTEIGYIPGEALGLREIAVCLNQPSCQTASGQLLELGQIDALIILTGERDSLINWVEQVEPRTNKPMLFGVTEGLAPMVQPYVVSDQIDGVVAGLPAAAAYEQAYQSEGSSGRLFQMQTLARILAIVVIIVGAGVALLPKKSADTE